MALQKVHDAAAIVCLGSFNPGIFHPAWLASRNLIQKTEEEAAEIQVISRDATQFKIGWLQLQVLRDRISASTDTPDDALLLRDLVVGVFKLLEHTPITAIGINRHLHFQMETENAWHHVGHALAPKKVWNKYMPHPGLQNLTIKDVNQEHKGKVPAEINVQLSPSTSRPNTIEVGINNHFVLEKGSAAALVASIVAEQWDSLMQSSQKLAEGVVSDALAEKIP